MHCSNIFARRIIFIIVLKCRLSGLIVDIFADVAVVASSAAWVEKYRHEIQFLVNKVSDVNHIKWRSSTDILKEEGLDVSEQKDPESSSHCGTVEVNQLSNY